MTVRFVIDGSVSTLAEMLAANAEDEHVCEWLRAARPGDVFDEFHGEYVECVAAMPPCDECGRPIGHAPCCSSAVACHRCGGSGVMYERANAFSRGGEECACDHCGGERVCACDVCCPVAVAS